MTHITTRPKLDNPTHIKNLTSAVPDIWLVPR